MIVQAPDNKVIDFGDMPADQVQAQMQRLYPSKQQQMVAENKAEMSGGGSRLLGIPNTEGVPERLGAYGLNALQAVPFSDEIISGAGAALGAGQGDTVSKRYENLQQRQQAYREAGRELNPGATTAGQLSAGLAMAPLMPGPKAAPTTLLQAATQGAKVGGAYGGLYGASEGDAFADGIDSVETRFSNALKGAGLGAAAGAPLGMLGYGVAKKLNPVPQQTEEDKILSDYLLTKDQKAPVDIAKNLRPGFTIADAAGPNTQTLAESLAQQPGQAMTNAVGYLEKRNIEAPNRINQYIEKYIGPLDFEQQRTANLGALGSPKVAEAYNGAYNAVPKVSDLQINKNLDQLLSSDVGKKIWKAAKDTAALEGKTLGNIDAVGNLRSLSTYGIDTIKQAADKLIGSPEAIGNFDRYTRQGRALINLTGGMVKRLDELNPAYAAARETFSTPASLLNAQDIGYKDLWGMNGDMAIKEFNSLSRPERDAAMSGVARKLSEMLKSQAGEGEIAGAGNAARTFLMNPKNRKILSSVLPPNKFESMMSALSMEAKGQDFANKAMQNSATGRRLAAKEDFADATKSTAEKAIPLLNYAANVKLTEPASLLGLTPQRVDQWAQGLSASNREQVGTELQSILLNPDYRQNMETLYRLNRFPNQRQGAEANLLRAILAGRNFAIQGPAKLLANQAGQQ